MKHVARLFAKQSVLLYYLLLMTFFLPLPSIAQTSDSIHYQPVAPDTVRLSHHWVDNKIYRMTHIAVPLIIIGSFTNGKKEKGFNEMRNAYIPRFRYHYDDYLQYAPGIIMLGLKTAGVKGRSSWGQMLVSDVFSAGIMATAVNSLKYTVRKERPDHSNNHSFPSGHTATAFMLATMLHKEYGLTRSPLYSVLGYSIATTTAVSRQLNNKHWFSDVLTGAGIGILSANLGYYLADLIFKDKEKKIQYLNSLPDSEQYSYLGIQMGYGIGEREIQLPNGIEIKGKGGVSSALNGGWFFNRHWGIGGKFSLMQSSPRLNTSFYNNYPETKPLIEEVETSSMTLTNLLLGVQYDCKLASRLHIGGSIMSGIGWTNSYLINVKYKDETKSTPLIHCKTHPIPNLDFNMHLLHVIDKVSGIKLFVNYNMARGKGDYTFYDTPSGNAPISGHHNFNLHNFYAGIEIDALFWK